jgi:hypothetical protein
MPIFAQRNWNTGDVFSEADADRIEAGIAAALPKDGSDPMTGTLPIKNAAPAVALLDTTASAKSAQIVVDGNAVRIDEVTAAGAFVATRVSVDLATGFVSGNVDKVDGVHFRENANLLEYSLDGMTWKAGGLPQSTVVAWALLL